MEEEKKTEEDVYEVSVKCDNCFHIGKLKIPVGVRVLESWKNGRCEKCGCNTLMRI